VVTAFPVPVTLAGLSLVVFQLACLWTVGLKLVLGEILAFADDGDACGRRDLVEGVV
jgi:hypothetical protein